MKNIQLTKFNLKILKPCTTRFFYFHAEDFFDKREKTISTINPKITAKHTIASMFAISKYTFEVFNIYPKEFAVCDITSAATISLKLSDIPLPTALYIDGNICGNSIFKNTFFSFAPSTLPASKTVLSNAKNALSICVYVVGKTTNMVTIIGAIFELVQNKSNRTTAIVGSARIMLIKGIIIFLKYFTFTDKIAKINANENENTNEIKLLNNVNANER